MKKEEKKNYLAAILSTYFDSIN